jgi:hypothetical protein
MLPSTWHSSSDDNSKTEAEAPLHVWRPRGEVLAYPEAEVLSMPQKSNEGDRDQRAAIPSPQREEEEREMSDDEEDIEEDEDFEDSDDMDDDEEVDEE